MHNSRLIKVLLCRVPKRYPTHPAHTRHSYFALIEGQKGLETLQDTNPPADGDFPRCGPAAAPGARLACPIGPCPAKTFQPIPQSSIRVS